MRFNSIINSFKYDSVTPLSIDGKLAVGKKSGKNNAGNYLLVNGKQVSDTKYVWFSTNLLTFPPYESQSCYFYGKRLDSNDFDIFDTNGKIVATCEQKQFEDDMVVEFSKGNQKQCLVIYPEIHSISQTFSKISESLNSRRERLAQLPSGMFAYLRNDGSIINEVFVSQTEPNRNGYYITCYLDENCEYVYAITNEYHIPTSPKKHLITLSKQGDFIRVSRSGKIAFVDQKGNAISDEYDSYTTLVNGTEIFCTNNPSSSLTIFPNGKRQELNNPIIDKKHGIVYGEGAYGKYEGHGFIYGLDEKYPPYGVSNAPAKLMMSILAGKRLPTSQISSVINESTDMQETIDIFTLVLKENSALYPENKDIKTAILTAEKELLRKMHRNSSDRERTYTRIAEEQEKAIKELEERRLQMLLAQARSEAAKQTLKMQQSSISTDLSEIDESNEKQ